MRPLPAHQTQKPLHGTSTVVDRDGHRRCSGSGQGSSCRVLEQRWAYPRERLESYAGLPPPGDRKMLFTLRGARRGAAEAGTTRRETTTAPRTATSPSPRQGTAGRAARPRSRSFPYSTEREGPLMSTGAPRRLSPQEFIGQNPTGRRQWLIMATGPLTMTADDLDSAVASCLGPRAVEKRSTDPGAGTALVPPSVAATATGSATAAPDAAATGLTRRTPAPSPGRGPRHAPSRTPAFAPRHTREAAERTP